MPVRYTNDSLNERYQFAGIEFISAPIGEFHVKSLADHVIGVRLANAKFGSEVHGIQRGFLCASSSSRVRFSFFSCFVSACFGALRSIPTALFESFPPRLNR